MTKNQAKRVSASRAGAVGSGPAARSAWKARYRKEMEKRAYPRKAKGDTSTVKEGAHEV